MTISDESYNLMIDTLDAGLSKYLKDWPDELKSSWQFLLDSDATLDERIAWCDDHVNRLTLEEYTGIITLLLLCCQLCLEDHDNLSDIFRQLDTLLGEYREKAVERFMAIH